MHARHRRTPPRDALLICALFLTSVFVATVGAYKDSNNGSTLTGCNCHGPTASSNVTVTLTGLPAKFTPGVTYHLTVNVSGGPAPGPKAAGGFDLAATAGTFKAPAGSTTVQVIYMEATQTANGSSLRHWDVDWVAPVGGFGSVRFYLAGLSANGDGKTKGDAWNLATYLVGTNGPVDDLPPVIRVQTPQQDEQLPSGTTYVTVSGKASDNFDVALVEVSRDNKTWVMAHGTDNWSTPLPVSSGRNIIYVKAQDLVGNNASASVVVDVKGPGNGLGWLPPLLLVLVVVLSVVVIFNEVRTDRPVQKKGNLGRKRT